MNSNVNDHVGKFQIDPNAPSTSKGFTVNSVLEGPSVQNKKTNVFPFSSDSSPDRSSPNNSPFQNISFSFAGESKKLIKQHDLKTRIKSKRLKQKEKRIGYLKVSGIKMISTEFYSHVRFFQQQNANFSELLKLGIFPL